MNPQTDLIRPHVVQSLSRQELVVLASLAHGRSNSGIAAELTLSERTIESHLRSILLKLDLAPSADTNRRVLAAAAWLSSPYAVP